MSDALTAHVDGFADDRLAAVVAEIEGFAAADPDYSVQVAAFAGGRPVLDVWTGPHLGRDSLMVPYSVSKNTLGLSIALLLERGLVDLDAPVAQYWPEFAAKDKQSVTVRQLLSHQAGLPQATPALTWAELLDAHAAADRLAASRPLWQPGSSFGYHALTIGNLGAELVFRITGRTLQAFYEEEIRRPHAVDFYLGLPESEDARRVPVLPMVRPEIDSAPRHTSLLMPLVWSSPGPELDVANDERSWRFGHAGASGTGSARGLARLFAAMVTGVDGAAPVLSPDTVEVVGLQQVSGYDEVLGQPHRAHSIVFQKPTPALHFGGPRAFGHDGAAGALACVDPDTGVTFAYTIARGPWPGGADPRALALAVEIGRIFGP
ncbi:Beta-lactamase [Microbacterium lemovicicum]|uniref:Beta-lactamase n=1 Tax=Microbacterium lemovicicum TaxID=1072463 RepID=A0A3Q9J1E7_9MICO|nr:serine hydrolase domain-containing protein [Microbacterium lemovicicum]AZS38228.1 Beta-lactamase [Microbacterium lemovicicum]